MKVKFYFVGVTALVCRFDNYLTKNKLYITVYWVSSMKKETCRSYRSLRYLPKQRNISRVSVKVASEVHTLREVVQFGYPQPLTTS